MGLGEEVGWRGLVQYGFCEATTSLTASLVLGVLWAGWHLPLVWTEGNSGSWSSCCWTVAGLQLTDRANPEGFDRLGLRRAGR